MNYSRILRSLLALTIASLTWIQTSNLSAQENNRPGGGQGRRGGGAGGAAIPNLSEEQRTALQELNRSTREISTRLAAARSELNAAIFAEKVDETAIKDKAAALAKIEAEYAVARANAFAKVRAKFTAEQIDAIKNSGGRGFGGGGPGGGGNRRQGGAN